MNIEKTDPVEKKNSQLAKKDEENKSEEHAIQSEEPAAQPDEQPEPGPIVNNDQHNTKVNKDDEKIN
jgi:hypothetical protein